MDFLDPRLKRSYNIRLAVGYLLIATVIGLTTLILIIGASGFGVNTKTGQIIENGLLFADSQPGGAEIFLNGQDTNSTTASRRILPAGNYTLTLKRAGYNDWQKSFTLNERSIARYTYPLLFPTKPQISSLKSYSAQPALISQSPDRRWLVVETPAGSFDVFDTSDLTKAPLSEELPADILSDGGASGDFEAVQWAADNTHLLLKHNFAGGSEFLIFNRDKPADSIAVNKVFGVNPTQVFLRNQKIDQLYLFDGSAGTVKAAVVNSGQLTPMLSGVLAFKPSGSQLATYISDKDAPSGQVQVRIWNNGKTYQLTTLKKGARYLVDAAQFNGHWYYLAGSDADARIVIFKDPLSALQADKPAKPVPLTALNQTGAVAVSFSGSAQFVEAENGNNFAVFDLQELKTYDYTLSAQLNGPLRWLDGARLTGDSAGQLFVMDYDSTNQQLVSASVEADGGYLSRDLHHFLTINANSASGAFELVNIDMRAGVDLPKQP